MKRIRMPAKRRFTSQRLRGMALLAAVSVPCWTCDFGRAASVTWDPSLKKTAGSDGSGTWNTTTANWSTGSADAVWNNSAFNTAVFGTTKTSGTYTITLGVPINAGGMTFNGTKTSSYTLTGGTLTLGGAATPAITVNTTSVIINSILAGSEGLTLAGTGALTLTGMNTYSGVTTISAGTLNIDSATALGTSSLTINGGTLDNNSAGDITLANHNAEIWGADFTYTGTHSLNFGTGAVTLGGNRKVTVSANTLAVGAIGDGGHGYSLTKLGSGTLQLSGANSYGGATTLSAGRLMLTSGSSLGNTAITVSAGATFAPNPDTGTIISGGTNLSMALGSVFNMAGDANVGQYLDRGPLTLQGATLYFDFGAGGANAVLDNLAASGAASISGSNTIDLIGFGSTAPTAGTYNLITAASGLGTGTFLLGTTSLVEGGTTYNFSLVRTATVVELAVTAKPPRSP